MEGISFTFSYTRHREIAVRKGTQMIVTLNMTTGVSVHFLDS